MWNFIKLPDAWVEQASSPVSFGFLVRQSLGGGWTAELQSEKRAPGGTPAATGQRPVPPRKIQVNPSGSSHFATFFYDGK